MARTQTILRSEKTTSSAATSAPKLKGKRGQPARTTTNSQVLTGSPPPIAKLQPAYR